jgi:hypothetical protein
MIEVLQVATKSPVFGYKKIVEGNDADDSLSDYRKHNINVKALYLLAAYKEAKKEMSFKTQSKCCQDTILTLSKKPESITFISITVKHLTPTMEHRVSPRRIVSSQMSIQT